MFRTRHTVLLGLLSAATTFVLAGLAYRDGEVAPHSATAAHARKLVADILAGKDRGSALCRLISLRRYRATPRYEPEPCSSRVVRQLIGSPDGEVFGVTVKADFIDEAEEAAYAGELILFDREGFIIPVYRGANVLTSEDGFFRYDNGERWAIVHAIRTSAGADRVVQILSVVPLAREQQDVLRIIVGASQSSYDCEGFRWSWQARDVDGDKRPEFELGPNVDTSGTISPRAVFHWSGDRYSGPTGSPSEGWLRLDVPENQVLKTDCCANEAAKRYADAATNREGARRPCARTASIESIVNH